MTIKVINSLNGKEIGELNCGPTNVPQRADILRFETGARYEVVRRQLNLRPRNGVETMLVVVVPV